MGPLRGVRDAPGHRPVGSGMIDPVTVSCLQKFRVELYQVFGTRRDALFELLDAVTTAGLVPSLAHLSLEAVHRRGWGSLYDAWQPGAWMNLACVAC
jgi:hypothetical protein